MKKQFLLLLIGAMSLNLVSAQDAQVPDFKNTPQLVKPDGSLSKLEKPTQEMKVKEIGFSYGKKKVTFLNIIGGNSPTKIDPTKATFIIKLSDAETDPEGMIYFTKLERLKSSREMRLAQSASAIAAAYGGKGKSVQADDIKAEFTKVSPGVYKFVPSVPLAPGTEYGIAVDQRGSNQGIAVFCFGTN